MSVGGEVLSQCWLDGCWLALKSSPEGMRLHWLTEEGGQQMLRGATSLPAAMHGGSLHPVFLDAVLEKALFKNTFKATNPSDCRSGASAALVVCDPGTVMAAHCKLPGQCVAVCHMAQSILWTGVLEVDHKSVIVVVSTGLTVSFGRTKEGEQAEPHAAARSDEPQHAALQWITKALPAAPLTCCGNRDMLLISDGCVCWLSHVSCSEKGKIVLKNSKLCIHGIIKISYEEKIHMESCDGRQYTCTWDMLSGKNGADGWKQFVKEKDTEQPHTIDELSKAIEKCSEVINMEGKAIETRLLYVKQLSIAQRLLKDQKCVFSATVTVEKRIESKDYIAKLRLKKTDADIDLRQRWWALCVVTDCGHGKSMSTIKLTDEQLKSEVYQIMLTLPPFDFSSASGNIEIRTYLVFENFTSSEPVCKVSACRVQVDIFDFIELECSLSTTCPARLYTRTAETSNASVSSMRSGLEKEPFPFSEISLSFMYNSQILELVCKLLNLTVVKDSEAKSDQTTLWYRDHRIDVECMEENEQILIKLKGSNPYVVLSSKAALERRVRELKQCVPEVTFPPSVLREASLTDKLLNNEKSSDITVATIAHLYHAITKLSSHIPLG